MRAECLACHVRSAALHVLFFFQAEDGIRDLTVTGVQTCALPIYAAWVIARSYTARVSPAMRSHEYRDRPRSTAATPYASISIGCASSCRIRCARDRKSVVRERV